MGSDDEAMDVEDIKLAKKSRKGESPREEKSIKASIMSLNPKTVVDTEAVRISMQKSSQLMKSMRSSGLGWKAAISKERGPLQLISVSQDLKTFTINQEALDIIRKLEGDIGIVAVSGAQRTGKSFILNLLLDRSGNGLGVS